ncbi:hypothetical protein [Duganella sp.]|uniref:hypothetical protein n=1 Tax=Duganella sp. TaxID=1904440 RepID=UPI0031DE4921
MQPITIQSSSGFNDGTDSYLELLQKQLDMAKKNAEAIDALSRRADQDQKSLARERVAEIKKQIDALRRMLLLFGGKDAKAVLQQLKDLASQLKQAAGILKASPDSAAPDTAASDNGDGYAAYAEQQASADADAQAAANPFQMPLPPFDAQRAEDDKQIEFVTNALKSLRAMTERMVKQQENQH